MQSLSREILNSLFIHQTLRTLKQATRQLVFLIVYLALCTTVFSAEEKKLDPVRVQLKWLHQFQFAGYYAAIEKGFYREAGLEVELIEGQPNMEPARVVLSGKAQFGVGTPELLLSYAKGEPVVMLGVIFQHSPLVFVTLKDSSIKSISDFNGKRIMFSPLSAELYAYLRQENIAVHNLQIVPHTFSVEELIQRTVDAMSGYSTNEPFTLEKKGIEYQTFTPRTGGIDFYGDCFFTTQDQVKKHPERVEAFREATLKGWEYAFKNTDEIIELIIKKYKSPKERDALQFEADEMRNLIHPELIPIGYMHAGRWEHIAETYRDLGMLNKDVDLSGFIYEKNIQFDYIWIYKLTAGLLAIALIIVAILLPVRRLKEKLRQQQIAYTNISQDLVTTREEMKQASMVKAEFLTNFSHDLRTPLHSIMVLSEIMQSETLDEHQRSSLGIIYESGGSLLQMVDDLLDLGRIESGTAQLANVPFLLDDVLDPISKQLFIPAKRKGVGFVHWIEAGLSGALRGDPDHLRQIVFNLGSNAVKFTEEGQIIIKARRSEKGWLRLEISDTGPGIPEDVLPVLFEPFVRGKTKRHKKGSGLGLAIVQKYTEAMGGNVYVSAIPGQETIFTVDIPILDSAEYEEMLEITKRLSQKRIIIALSSALRRKAAFHDLRSLNVTAVEVETIGKLTTSDILLVDSDSPQNFDSDRLNGARCIRIPSDATIKRRTLANAILSDWPLS